MATAKTASPALSAVDRIKAERSVGAYQFTDEIVIHPPTYKQSQEFDAAPDFDAKMTAWLGADTYKAFMDVLDAQEASLVPYILEDFLGHFYGADVASKIVTLSEQATAAALEDITLESIN